MSDLVVVAPRSKAGRIPWLVGFAVLWVVGILLVALFADQLRPWDCPTFVDTLKL